MLARLCGWAIGTAGVLVVGTAVTGCQGRTCGDVLLCTATQEEADHLNATAECPNYGYCPWMAEHDDAGGDADGADAADDVIHDDADAGE